MLFISVVTPLREIHRILDEAHESSIRVLDFFDLMDLPEDNSFAMVPAIAKRGLRENEPAVKYGMDNVPSYRRVFHRR